MGDLKNKLTEMADEIRWICICLQRIRRIKAESMGEAADDSGRRRDSSPDKQNQDG